MSHHNPALTHFIDEGQLEARTGISRRNWERKRIRGDGPPFVKIGRLVRYPVAELDAWLAAHLRHSTSDPGPEGRPAA